MEWLIFAPAFAAEGAGCWGAWTDGGAQFFDKVGETRKENEREENQEETMDGGARVKDNSRKDIFGVKTLITMKSLILAQDER